MVEQEQAAQTAECEKFSEEKADCIIEMVSKLCLWEDHKDPLECQDCPEFDNCKMYEYCITLYDFILKREEEASKRMAKTILQTLYDWLWEDYKCGTHILRPEEIKELAKEFDTEVE